MKKRLRKKMRLGEFKEIGFKLEFACEPSLTSDEQDDIFFDFLDHAIEANNLLFGGVGQKARWSGVAFASGPPGTKTTSVQRAATITWLEDNPHITSVNAGGFIDLWYGEFS